MGSLDADPRQKPCVDFQTSSKGNTQNFSTQRTLDVGFINTNLNELRNIS